MVHVKHLIDLVTDLRIFIIVVVDEAEHIGFPGWWVHLISLFYLDLIDISRRLIIVVANGLFLFQDLLLKTA